TSEQNKSAAAGFLDEMRDPTFQLFLISGLARVGHFFHDEHFHLLLEIEGTAELQRLGFGRADALSEISEIGASDRQRGARHHASGVVPENHPPKNRRQIDRRGVEREKLRGPARALDPVDMLRRALLQKLANTVTRVANPAPEFLELGF